MTELEVRAGEELERKIERYARLRLDPSAAQAKRARSVLMEAAWRQRLAEPAQAPLQSPHPPGVCAARSRAGAHGVLASRSPPRCSRAS